jgi:hypothetical protein
MKITAFLGQKAEYTALPGTQREASHWRLSWRRELERAQLEQRQRYQAASRAALPDEQSPSLAPATKAIKSVADVPEQLNLHTRASSATNFVGVERQRLAVAESAMIKPAPRPSTQSNGVGVMFQVSGNDEAPALARPLQARVAALFNERCASGCLTASLHVSVTGNQLHVAVRDIQLTGKEVVDLRNKLRQQVLSWGYELSGFIVNGEPIEASDTV